MPNVDLCLEALSSLSAFNVEQTTGTSQLSPQDFVNVVALKEFYKQEGFKQLDYPHLGTLSLIEPPPPALETPPVLEAGCGERQAANYSPPPPLEEGSLAASPAPKTTLKINLDDFFDSQYDYDFTNIKDGDTRFTRGDEQYLRPCGWNRVALRVLGKYDEDSWLGTGSGAWPVSYHGYDMSDPDSLNTADSKAARGVYSTADIKIAERFCKKFESSVDGKTYMVVLQNRINPKKRVKCQREGYWLFNVPEGSSDDQTRAIVQESLRPYGLLLKQV